MCTAMRLVRDGVSSANKSMPLAHSGCVFTRGSQQQKVINADKNHEVITHEHQNEGAAGHTHAQVNGYVGVERRTWVSPVARPSRKRLNKASLRAELPACSVSG